MDVPRDVLKIILSYVAKNKHHNFARTCKLWNEVARTIKEIEVWRQLFLFINALLQGTHLENEPSVCSIYEYAHRVFALKYGGSWNHIRVIKFYKPTIPPRRRNVLRYIHQLMRDPDDDTKKILITQRGLVNKWPQDIINILTQQNDISYHVTGDDKYWIKFTMRKFIALFHKDPDIGEKLNRFL